MGEKTDGKFYFDGQEITGISESDININFEQNLVERDCEINTVYGVIRFKDVFTREQWGEFIEVSKKAGVNNG